MPTLAEILGGIDSVVTPAKRRLSDLLRNPLAYSQQALGNVGDNMAQFSQNALRAQEGQDLTRMGSVMGDAPQYRNALSATINGLMGVAPVGATKYISENPSQGLLEMANLSRKDVQAKAKEMGLPATGKTDEIQKRIDILGKHPSEWTREEFDAVSPHLWIHQDTKPGSADRVQSIMQNGLNGGMADNLGSIANGSWSWARRLLGSDAYVLPPNVKYRPGDSGYLGEGNKPLFHIKPEKGQDVYEAIKMATKPE